MSKQALALLARNLGEDVIGETWQGSSKEGFRQKNLDYKPQHVLDSSVAEIEAQIRTQIALYDKKAGTDFYFAIEDANAFTKAAEIFLNTLNSSFTAEEKAAAKDIPGVIAVCKNYDGVNKRRIIPAEKAAKDFLEQTTNKSMDKFKLVSPDHSNPNAEIRFSRALYSAVSQKNPSLDTAEQIVNVGKAVIMDLGNTSFMGRPLITPETRDYFVDSFVKISSRFTGNLSQKEFDLEFGAELAPRSQLDNELHGRQVQNYTKELAKAAATIAGKTNWAAQESSDSYITAVMKQINNAAVKAGGTGKIQSINSAANTSEVKKRLKGKTQVDKIKLGSKTTPKVWRKIQQKPIISLQSIVDYINSRLPDAMRKNMGTGSLVNRTGRFADSARLTGAEQTKEGYISLIYTYLRSPYDVFDPVLGRSPWNTPSRNPSEIVKKSVRDIARDMAIGRFYLRRA